MYIFNSMWYTDKDSAVSASGPRERYDTTLMYLNEPRPDLLSKETTHYNMSLHHHEIKESPWKSIDFQLDPSFL